MVEKAPAAKLTSFFFLFSEWTPAKKRLWIKPDEQQHIYPTAPNSSLDYQMCEIQYPRTAQISVDVTY